MAKKTEKPRCSEHTANGSPCKLPVSKGGKCHVHNRRPTDALPTAKVKLLSEWREQRKKEIEQGIQDPEALLVESLLWARDVRDGNIKDWRNTNTKIEQHPAAMRDRIHANAEVRRTLQFILELPDGSGDRSKEEIQAEVRRLLGS